MLRDGPVLGTIVGNIDFEGASLGTSDGPELRLGILLGLELGETEMDGAVLATTVGDVLGR